MGALGHSLRRECTSLRKHSLRKAGIQGLHSGSIKTNCGMKMHSWHLEIQPEKGVVIQNTNTLNSISATERNKTTRKYGQKRQWWVSERGTNEESSHGIPVKVLRQWKEISAFSIFFKDHFSVFLFFTHWPVVGFCVNSHLLQEASLMKDEGLTDL